MSAPYRGSCCLNNLETVIASLPNKQKILLCLGNARKREKIKMTKREYHQVDTILLWANLLFYAEQRKEIKMMHHTYVRKVTYLNGRQWIQERYTYAAHYERWQTNWIVRPSLSINHSTICYSARCYQH